MPAIGCAVAVAMPIVYLLVRAFQADVAQVGRDLWRHRTLLLLGNTVLLTIGVLVFATVLAFPIAWLTTRANLRGRRFFALIGVLPLAVPGYIMAYALLGLGEYGGPWHLLAGAPQPAPKGFWGAMLALGMYNMPYMYLNLRAGICDLDLSITEAGLSLGRGRLGVLIHLVFPQLRPALLAGALIVSLHVIGDFGVVSLMDYETLSFALYEVYSTGDRVAAAAPALMLIVLSLLILAADMWFLRGLVLHRTTSGLAPHRPLAELGWWACPAHLFLAVVLLIAVLVPAAMVTFWIFQPTLTPVGHSVVPALCHSLLNSMPAALGATALAIPVAFLGRRYPSPLSSVLERCAFAGYAVPALAFALGLIFFASKLTPVLYQSFVLLIGAYSIHFLAEAVGPIRSGLYLANPRLEEASRGLGVGRIGTFRMVTLPLLRNSLIVAAALVFLSVMKELPLTMLLAPVPFNETLAFNVWSHTENGEFAEAAPFALCILLSSAAFVGVLLLGGRKSS